MILFNFTWIAVPISGNVTVFPGTGGGHWLMSWQAASKLSSPWSKNSGAMMAITSLNNVIKGSLVIITTL
mgnify:CR=1 FL=1